MGHAKLSPSSSKRWLTCTQSVLLPEKEEKEKESEFAKRGTALHAMSEDILRGEEVKSEYFGYRPDKEDIILTVEKYVEYVRNLDADIFYYEKKVYVTEDCYGTADVIAFNSEKEIIHVVDLKAGKGIYVSAEDNTQLMIYAIGAIKFLLAEGLSFKSLFIHIVQPGRNNFQSIQVDRQELKALHKKIKQTEKDIQEGNIEYAASDEACLWCPHKINCEELKKVASKAAFEEFSSIELSEKMKLVPLLKTFIKTVEDKVQEELRSDRPVPGFILKRRSGRRAWNIEKEKEILHDLNSAGISEEELFTPKKMITVAQTEKVLKLNKIDLDLSDYVIKGEGSVYIAKEKSEGEVLDKTAEAKKDFK